MAETLSVKLDDDRRIDSLIGRAEKRYASALHEIEHHREALAEAVQATKVAEDAEFEDILPKSAANGATHMTSERQRQANRANAQSSTGPKTREGQEGAPP